jgi:short subunit dehydrogenase-like uncharacterized protein
VTDRGLPQRPLDVVVYGATGFTGAQCAAYLAAHAPMGVRWTVAGRRADALRQVAERVGAPEPPIVADSSDPASLQRLAARSRVVLSTAGPFSLYGEPVVRACVDQRTHYVDITGETPWVAQMIAAHHDRARIDGTRVVPMCGFDSVPSDLGARLAAAEVRARFGRATRRVTAVFALRGGGLNGGTLASGLALAERYPGSDLDDPFLLSPGAPGAADPAAHADPTGPVFEPIRQRWVAPFVMGPANTRVVRRSAMLLASSPGQAFGADFAYQEYVDVRGGTRGRARLMATAMRVGRGLLGSAAGRALLRAVGPRPGAGPSQQARDSGSFRVWYVAEADDGRLLQAEMTSPGDAGNVSTVRFCCEAALALACDETALGVAPGNGGVLTPAVALWPTYPARLAARGVAWRVLGEG